MTSNMTSSPPGGGGSLGQKLWIIFGPIIFVIGVTGNILIICVMSCRRMRKTTTCIYLRLMAIADLSVVLTGVSAEWLEAMGILTFKFIHPVTCKMEKFVFYTCADTAVWILVIFTIDRFIAVVFPLHKRRLCGPSRAQLYCAMALLAAVAKNFHVFWTRGAEYRTPTTPTTAPANQNQTLPPLVVGRDVETVLTMTNQTLAFLPSLPPMLSLTYGGGLAFEEGAEFVSNCGRPSPAYRDFELYVRPWIAFTLVSVLPFVIIAVCNVFIVQSLKDVKKIRERQANSSSMSLAAIAAGSGSVSAGPAVTGSSGITAKAAADRTLVQMTAMCLSASFCFLICIAPSIVLLIMRPYWAGTPSRPNVAYNTAKAANNILVYVNHSLNFFLYSLTGKRFRTELVAMVTFERRRAAAAAAAAAAQRHNSTGSQSSGSDATRAAVAAAARKKQQRPCGGQGMRGVQGSGGGKRRNIEPLYHRIAGGGYCSGDPRHRAYQQPQRGGRRGDGETRAIYRLGSGVLALNAGLIHPPSRDGTPLPAARDSPYRQQSRLAHLQNVNESEL